LGFQSAKKTAECANFKYRLAFIFQEKPYYPKVATAVELGREVFERNCSSCHSDGLGANTNEKMVRLDEVGRFFTPTIYQKEVESIRATFLCGVYWTQSRGLLSDSMFVI
jgi:hypothetical protein